ncbi:MAG: GNAT family N-acetyltransferase [Xanthomonadaceae bacterium]|jgi:GNAT superfamily N-acetyltransferase|nr:GNAT family N-acetyltransferase [Xanthomonadaceae bacterium]
MDDATRLRDATRADLESLVAFNAAMALETEHKRLDPALLRPGVAAVFDDPRRGFYLVAERGGTVVGGLLVTWEWSDWRCGDWWWVQSVYVVPPARGQGVFGALYRAIEARARAAGAVGLRLYVERDNRRAQRTYAALGMEETAYRMYERPFGPADGR